MDTFGERLRTLRKAAGLRQEEVAAAMGLPPTAMSRMEKGTRDVTFAEAQALARVLQVDLAALAGQPEEGLGRTLHRLVMACSVAGRHDAIGLLRGIADALEASLPETPGRDGQAHGGHALAQQTALGLPAPEPGPPHHGVVLAQGCEPPEGRGAAPVQRATRGRRRSLLSLGMALGAFLLDLWLPLGVVVGIPYVAVVALASSTLRWRAVVGLALGCTGLTLLGFVGSPPGAPVWMDVTDRALAVGTLWATVCFVCHARRGEVALRPPHAHGYAPL